MKLVTITQAAKAIDVHKSTLSRYVSANPKLNHQTEEGCAPLVDVDEVLEHRAENLDQSKSGNRAGAPFNTALDEPSEGTTGVSGERRSPGNNKQSDLGYRKAATAEKAIKAKSAQLKLARDMSLVVARSDVESAAFEVGQKLLQELAIRNRHLAEQFAVLDDPKDIARVLSEADREMLERIADAFSRIFEPDTLAAE